MTNYITWYIDWVSHDLPVMSHDPLVVSHDLPVLSHDLPVLSHDLPVLSHDLPVLCHMDITWSTNHITWYWDDDVQPLIMFIFIKCIHSANAFPCSVHRVWEQFWKREYWPFYYTGHTLRLRLYHALWGVCILPRHNSADHWACESQHLPEQTGTEKRVLRAGPAPCERALLWRWGGITSSTIGVWWCHSCWKWHHVLILVPFARRWWQLNSVLYPHHVLACNAGILQSRSQALPASSFWSLTAKWRQGGVGTRWDCQFISLSFSFSCCQKVL